MRDADADRACAFICRDDGGEAEEFVAVSGILDAGGGEGCSDGVGGGLADDGGGVDEVWSSHGFVVVRGLENEAVGDDAAGAGGGNSISCDRQAWAYRDGG